MKPMTAWTDREKGARNLLCEAPEGPFRQKVPGTFFRAGLLWMACLAVALYGPTFAPAAEEPNVAVAPDGTGKASPVSDEAPIPLENLWEIVQGGGALMISIAICSLILGGVLDRLPGLRIAFDHGGGAFPGILGRIDQAYGSRPDLVAVKAEHSPRHYLDRFYVDSLVHDAASLRRLLDLFGSERILLGSDYPFPLGEAPPGKVLDELTDLGDDIHIRVRGENALEFLGLPAGRFLK